MLDSNQRKLELNHKALEQKLEKTREELKKERKTDLAMVKKHEGFLKKAAGSSASNVLKSEMLFADFEKRALTYE